MESNKNGVQSATLSDLAPANEILDKIIADEKANGFIDNAELLKDNEFGGLKKLDLKGPRDHNNNRNRNNNNKREGGNAPQNKPNNPNPQNPNQPNRNPNKFKKPYSKNKGPRNNEGGNNAGGNTPPPSPPPQS